MLRTRHPCNPVGTFPAIVCSEASHHITTTPTFFFNLTRGRATVFIFSIPLFFLELLSRTVAMANMTGQTVTIDRAYFETILRR